MHVFYKPKDLHTALFAERVKGNKIGLVPTMGALHEGHISLIERSKKENDLTVCSIFVNPLQFNNANDLLKYPRTLEKDIKMLEKAGCDIVFAPDVSTIYVTKPGLAIDFGDLERVMEGKFRPGHFNGVAIIVSKLFHMVDPDRAYFGQKDLQQYLIIKQLVDSLSFRVELISCDIIREQDGLAMSSRNQRLLPEHRVIANNLYKALELAKELVLKNHLEKAEEAVKEYLSPFKSIQLEYLEIADGNTLIKVGDLKDHSSVAICIAAFLGEVRLIDNIIVELN